MRYYQNRSFSAVSLTVVEENGDIVYIGFGDDVGRATKRETPVIAEAFSQLSAYFDGRLKTFSLPLKLSGTPFQLKTWEALKTIPYGETRSYRDIARQRKRTGVPCRRHGEPPQSGLYCDTLPPRYRCKRFTDGLRRRVTHQGVASGAGKPLRAREA